MRAKNYNREEIEKIFVELYGENFTAVSGFTIFLDKALSFISTGKSNRFKITDNSLDVNKEYINERIDADFVGEPSFFSVEENDYRINLTFSFDNKAILFGVEGTYELLYLVERIK